MILRCTARWSGETPWTYGEQSAECDQYGGEDDDHDQRFDLAGGSLIPVHTATLHMGDSYEVEVWWTDESPDASHG